MVSDDPNLYLTQSHPQCLWCKQHFPDGAIKNFCSALCHEAWLELWVATLKKYNKFEVTF